MVMFYRKKDQLKRKILRNNPTKAESILWQELRNKKIAGFRFRRQFSIGGFIVDFYCMETKLAIEVDGGYHLNTKEYDILREQAIQKFGIHFIRFTNAEVLSDLDTVLLKIEQKLLTLCSRRNGGPARLRQQGVGFPTAFAGGMRGIPDMDEKEKNINNPLHGLTLEMILNKLVEKYGWEEMGKMIPINCFKIEPSITSSLRFLRKTPWARKRVEDLFIYGPPRRYFQRK